MMLLYGGPYVNHVYYINNRPQYVIPSSYLSALHMQAKQREIECDITIEDLHTLWLKQNGKCALTNISLELKYRNKSKQTASIDRKDSSKSYTINNIQWVHKNINYMKMDLEQQEFIDMCILVAKHNKKKKQKKQKPIKKV